MHFTRRVLSRAALSNGPMQAPQGMYGAGRKRVSNVALQGYALGLISWAAWYKIRDPLDFDKLRVSHNLFFFEQKKIENNNLEITGLLLYLFCIRCLYPFDNTSPQYHPRLHLVFLHLRLRSERFWNVIFMTI